MLRLLRHHAFTIIEILFLIAIIGVIAAFSLTLHSKQAEATKITKTAVEMQNIIQAADYYYALTIDHNPNHQTFNQHIWPDQSPDYVSSLNCDGKTGPAPQLCTYLSLPPDNKVLKNPWGKGYQWKAVYKPLTPPTNTFYLQTTVPTAAIATRLAGKLPNGSSTEKTVTIKIGPPGHVDKPDPGKSYQVLGAVGIFRRKDNPCVKLYCPPGTVYDNTWTAVNSFETGPSLHTLDKTDLIKYVEVGANGAPGTGGCAANEVPLESMMQIDWRYWNPWAKDAFYRNHVDILYVITCKRAA